MRFLGFALFVVALSYACRPAAHSPVDWCAPEDRECLTCRDGSRCPGGTMQCSPIGGCEPEPPPVSDVPAAKKRDAGQ